MNLGFHPYTLLFTYQIIASQLVYQKVEPPSKCSIVKNQIFPIWYFLGVLLSNTLKRIKAHSAKATNKNFVSYSEDSGEYISYNPYPKISFSRNVSPDKTSFDSLAAHPRQKIWAFVTDKPAAKQVLPESLKHWMISKLKQPLPPLMLFHLKTLMPLKVVFFRGLEVTNLSIILRISTTTFIYWMATMRI